MPSHWFSCPGSICLISLFVHLKNGSEYIAMRTIQEFIHLLRIFLKSLVFCFWFFWRTPFFLYGPCEFFTPSLADGPLLESERYHVSSGFQDTSQYCNWSQQCCSLEGFELSDFQLSLPHFQTFGNVPSASITIGITVTLMFQKNFNSLARSKTCLSFLFLWFSLCYPLGRQSSQFFLLTITSSSILLGIRLSVCTSKFKIIVRLILQDGFWLMLLPFCSIVNFSFLAQFSMNHLPRPVVSSLILLLRKFSTFAYYVINRFFSITI